MTDQAESLRRLMQKHMVQEHMVVQEDRDAGTQSRFQSQSILRSADIRTSIELHGSCQVDHEWISGALEEALAEMRATSVAETGKISIAVVSAENSLAEAAAHFEASGPVFGCIVKNVTNGREAMRYYRSVSVNSPAVPRFLGYLRAASQKNFSSSLSKGEYLVNLDRETRSCIGMIARQIVARQSAGSQVKSREARQVSRPDGFESLKSFFRKLFRNRTQGRGEVKT